MKTSIVLGSGRGYNFDELIMSLSHYVNNNLKSFSNSYEIGVILSNDYHKHYKNIMSEDDYYVEIVARLLDMIGDLKDVKNRWEIQGENGSYIMMIDDNIPFSIYCINIVNDILGRKEFMI